jgi:glycosyltransferase involved in cell wall biosynthesis
VPDVRFFAVGQDPPPELRDLSAKDPRITVTGFVDDIRPYVSKAAVYVVPLRVGGGTRLKVLDAMASGKALVSTAIGCEGIAVRPGEHLVVADTPEAMAASTIALLNDPARRQALGAAARRLVEQRYAWRVVGGQLLDAYRDAAARQRRAS